jgi:predicted NAD/FAD-binding protein
MTMNIESADTKPRLAVIGAGLAGLSAAWLLSKQYSVTLYERHQSAGMGVFTTDYHSNGLSTRIDIPLRIFTPSYYPSLFALYEYLDIEMESSDHAGVFQYLSDTHSITPFFQYHNRKLLGLKLSYLNRNSLTKTGLLLAYQQWCFFKTIKKDFSNKKAHLASITFKEYLSNQSFSSQFINHMLLPALAVTLTCDFESVGNYPADLILEYLTCGVMKQGIVRAKLGVDGIIPKITKGYEVKCSHEVIKVEQGTGNVRVTVKDTQTNQSTVNEFDQVVVACQADIAANILSLSDDVLQQQQAKLLSSIPLEHSTMVLHTDATLIFDAKNSSPVSYLLSENENRAATTVDLTKAFSTYKDQQPVFQTWHPIKQPTAESILSQAQFSRPLVTLESRQSIKQLQQLNKQSPVKICGSYMANRFPLLDAAVESSVAIAKELGAEVPWEATPSTQESSDANAGVYA